MKLRFARPSPAMVVAVIALVMGFTGGAVALKGKNKVDANDLKRKVVKAKNLRANAVTDAKIPDLKFQALTPQGNWVSPGAVFTAGATLGVAKDGYGVVHLKGVASDPSSAGGTITTLPTAFRPPRAMILPAVCASLGSVSAALIIDDDGAISVNGHGAGNQQFCEENGATVLDGVSFRTTGG